MQTDDDLEHSRVVFLGFWLLFEGQGARKLCKSSRGVIFLSALLVAVVEDAVQADDDREHLVIFEQN